VLVELDGCRVLTDPVRGRRVVHLWRHSAPAPALGRIDAVLISHAHHDHLDVRSLRRLPHDTRIIAPPGSTDLIRRKGFSAVTQVSPGEEVELGPLTIRAVPALHYTRRAPRGAESPALGFRIGGSASALFLGDTDLFDEMAEIEPVDVALVPIWGWGPSIGPGHLNPERAAQAVKLLRPRYAVPIHWGTFAPALVGALRPGFLSRPGPAFARHAARIAPDVEVRVLAPGESLDVGVHPR
jgi:L-ascorbate metabolism protein UlaG (beta-lactamase superfamily)